MPKILVVDDDSYIRKLLEGFLAKNGYDVRGADTGLAAIRQIDKDDLDLILCDYRLPDLDGLKILQHVKSINTGIPVIIMTAYADIKLAVQLIKLGSFDYVIKPVQPEEILHLINTALKSRKEKPVVDSFNNVFITGKSPKMVEVMNHVKIISPTDITVLIEGETGSGKEYIARAIHHTSPRKKMPFVAIDCGAIPKDLANSELFGHVKGAFTGAVADKTGYFEQARGGTLFLDEVGNLPYENQNKLLRALQEKIITRVGDNKPIQIDVRIITASNEDLLKLVDSYEFREDLYHRLNGFKIQLPSLKDRGEDIFEFADFFIRKANEAFNKHVISLDQDVRELFLTYDWYGNIRELQNVIYRSVLLTDSDSVSLKVLPEEIRINVNHRKNRPETIANNRQTEISDLKNATQATEKEVIINALIKTNYNKSKAAQLLNIDRKTLYNKIKLFNIDTDRD